VIKYGSKLSATVLAIVVSLVGRGAVTRAEQADLRGVARVGGSPAANAVVWLTTPGPATALTSKPIVLDQRNLAFIPRVLVVRVGATVDFPNNDRVFHNVFSFRDGKRFDLGLYPVGTSRKVTFDRAGLSRIFCNIHPNMAAYVMAVDTAYYAVSDESGAFAIRAVPPGAHAYSAWRPGSPQIDGTWSSTLNAPLAIDWR
jgi:plastocyanin